MKIVVNDRFDGPGNAPQQSDMTAEKIAATQEVLRCAWGKMGKLTKYAEMLKVQDQPHGVQFILILEIAGEKMKSDAYYGWDQKDGFTFLDFCKTASCSPEALAQKLVSWITEKIQERADSLRDSAEELEDDLAEHSA